MDVRIGKATLSIVNGDITEQNVDIVTNDVILRRSIPF